MGISSSTTRDTVQAGDYYPPENHAVSSYETDEGLLVLPLAEASSGGSPVEFVRVHQPIRRRVYEFAAAKSKTPPLIAAPQENSKEYLITSQMTFPMPSIQADRSTLLWRASGQMVFYEKGSWTIASGYRIGNYPVQDVPASLAGLMDTTEAASLDEAGQSYGELLADQLDGFPSGDQYANKTYDYAPHFPSLFMVEDLSLGN